MPPKKELCRNFQRGSCQYGERCKFLHVTQQLPRQNVFGFGTQSGSHFQHANSQQQKPNPFGFGVPNSSQSKKATDLGSKQNQFKHFENKWTRFSPITTGSSPPLRQSDNQPQAANHKCTDPESCKRQIIEDFEHERPLWRLTCYGHCKGGPCDIVGDISYEELRAAAYDDAKSGLSLQSIVDKERSLLNSKLVEFEGLLRNPSVALPNSTVPNQSPYIGNGLSVPPLSAQIGGPPSVSSFSQLGASLNMGSGVRPSASPNAFGQSDSVQNSNQTSNLFGTNNLPFGNAGPFGSQISAQLPGTSSASSMASSSNTVVIAESNLFPPPVVSHHIPSFSSNQSTAPSGGFNPGSNIVGQAAANVNFVNNLRRENVAGDESIWKQETWNAGEIPEEAPPDIFV